MSKVYVKMKTIPREPCKVCKEISYRRDMIVLEEDGYICKRCYIATKIGRVLS